MTLPRCAYGLRIVWPRAKRSRSWHMPNRIERWHADCAEGAS